MCLGSKPCDNCSRFTFTLAFVGIYCSWSLTAGHSPTLERPPFCTILSTADFTSLELVYDFRLSSVTGSSLRTKQPHYVFSSKNGAQSLKWGSVRLPVLDDAHHGSGHTHVDGLSHVRQEVLLDFKAPLPDAPAPVHQEGQVHLTVCNNGTSWETPNVNMTVVVYRAKSTRPL